MDQHHFNDIECSSSFPGIHDLGYGDDMANTPQSPTEVHTSENKPRILLMGLRRSGKSSIQKVVFHKMAPNETLFLESTNKIVKSDISNSSFVQFQIWDFPGQIDFFDQTFDSEAIFSNCGALVFVIDSQDNYNEAVTRLHQTVKNAFKVNQKITFEVFIHKADGLTDDAKIETSSDIQQQIRETLESEKNHDIHISFHLTSIYDHSIFEAFSKVIQNLIPQLPTLEHLLNALIVNSRMEKAFLIDVVSKIYVATDSSVVDMQIYELCSDMIDVVVDMSFIYGADEDQQVLVYDEETRSTIKMNNGGILILREVNKYLVLVCLIRDDNYDKHGIIDYNFQCFKRAITEVFKTMEKH